MLMEEKAMSREVQKKFEDYAYVLEEGRNKCDGPAEEIRTDAEIKKLYLGG